MIDSRLTAARILLSAWSAASLAWACEPSEPPTPTADPAAERDAVIARVGPAVRANEKKLRDVATLAAAAPAAPPNAAAPVLVPPARLAELHLDEAAANTDVLLQRELSSPTRGIIGSCLYHLARGGRDLSATALEKNLTRCGEIRYFVVLRALALDRPVIGSASGTYAGGDFSGEALVFDLAGEGDKPALRGAFWLAAALTTTVKVDLTAADDRKEYALMEALRKEILRELERKLASPPPP